MRSRSELESRSTLFFYGSSLLTKVIKQEISLFRAFLNSFRSDSSHSTVSKLREIVCFSWEGKVARKLPFKALARLIDPEDSRDSCCVYKWMFWLEKIDVHHVRGISKATDIARFATTFLTEWVGRNVKTTSGGFSTPFRLTLLFFPPDCFVASDVDLCGRLLSLLNFEIVIVIIRLTLIGLLIAELKILVWRLARMSPTTNPDQVRCYSVQ